MEAGATQTRAAKPSGRAEAGGAGAAGGRPGAPFPPAIAYTNRPRIGNSSRHIKTKRVVVRGLPPAAPAPPAPARETPPLAPRHGERHVERLRPALQQHRHAVPVLDVLGGLLEVRQAPDTLAIHLADDVAALQPRL